MLLVMMPVITWADEAPATAPTSAPTTQPGPRIWKLTSFLNGTASEIAKSINGPVNELAERLAEKERPLTGLEKALSDAEARVLSDVHRSPEYQKLKAEYEARRQEVDEMRATGRPAAERMNASGRMNRALDAMNLMERRQLNTDPIVVRARSDLRTQQAERERAIKSIGASLQKQLAWRNQLVAAMRTTFQMQGPLKLDRDGLLGEITPITILGPSRVLADYNIAERVQEGGRIADGINSFTAVMHRYMVVVDGVDTSKMEKGKPVNFDKHFRVTGLLNRPAEWGLDMPLMLFRLQRVEESDLDQLFDKVNDFREPTLPAHARGQ